MNTQRTKIEFVTALLPLVEAFEQNLQRGKRRNWIPTLQLQKAKPLVTFSELMELSMEELKALEELVQKAIPAKKAKKATERFNGTQAVFFYNRRTPKLL